MKMVVALLALVSAGIFGAHILDALRADHHGVDFRLSHSASDRTSAGLASFEDSGRPSEAANRICCNAVRLA
jgi:hypothetical protein